MIGKQIQSRKRAIAGLSARAEKRLASYLAAAGAAGAGLFAWAQPAAAEVVYSSANQVLGGNSIYQVDLNNDGIADINLTAYAAFTDLGSSAFLSYAGINASAAQPGNEVLINKYGGARPGKRGQEVRPVDPFASFASMNFHIREGNGTGSFHETHGPWLNLTHRFLGVKFLINGETHYGWLRMSVGGPDSGMLTGYAYETEPNTPIVCGFKQYDHAPAVPHSHKPWPTPEIHKVVPASLGALATGSAGLDAWRGNQTEAQSASPASGK